jgi:hypothetical protein
LGYSEFNNMYFDLDSILVPIDDLDGSVLPFSNDEVDVVIRNLKLDKSLGLDGFNTYIMKKCWDIIKYDFYDLCTGFYNHEI